MAPVSEYGITAPGGNPDELRDVARFLRAASEGFTQIADNVRRAGSNVGNAWSGPASLVFKQRVNFTTRAIETAPDACGRAAGALERLATALERAQRRAAAAQEDAGEAINALATVSRERTAISGTPVADDPAVQRRLSDRESNARSDLISARKEGADAYADAQAAAAEAAKALNAAAGAFGLPPQPADPKEVPPFESTAHWIWRQLVDVAIDPLVFWNQPDAYKGGRSIFDTVTGAGGALVGGMSLYRMDLFQHEMLRVTPGLLVPRTTVTFDPATGLLTRNTTWIQQINYSTVRAPNLAATSRIASIAKKAGPVGHAIALGTAGLDQWYEDRNRTDLSGGEKAARVAGASAIVGGASIAGGIAGAKVGAMAGAAIGSFFPGPGTAIGGVVGGIVGGVIGSGVGQAIGSKIKGWLFGG